MSNTNYSYKIKAINSSGSSSFSNCASATTLLSTPIISFSGISENQIQLTWAPSAGATYYEIYNCNGSLLSTQSSLMFTLSGLVAGSIYDFKIKAKSSGNTSLMSSCSTTSTVPSMPINLLISSGDCSSLLLNWSGTTSPNISFQIYSASGTYIGTTNTTSYSIFGLQNNTFYQFMSLHGRVKANQASHA